MKESEILAVALRQLLAAQEQIAAALVMVNALAEKSAERTAAAQAVRDGSVRGIVPDDGRPPLPAVFGNGKGRPEDDDRPATAPPVAPPVS